MDNYTKIFPTAPGLDQDLGSIRMLLDSFDKDQSDPLEYSDYYQGINKPQGGESGDVTPVSCGSEIDFNTNDATAGSSAAEFDVTFTEDIMMGEEDSIDPDETLTNARLNALSNFFAGSSSGTTIENNLLEKASTPRLMSPMNNTNLNICSNMLHSPTSEALKHIDNIERVQSSSPDYKNIMKKSNVYDKELPSFNKNLANLTPDKWSTTKEKFLENKALTKTDNIDFGKNLNLNKEKKVEKENELKKIRPGAVVVKESYIELPRISRVSRSFHGKPSTSTSHLDICSIPRRASDGPPVKNWEDTQNLYVGTKSKNTEKAKTPMKRPQLMMQMSHPCDGNYSSTSSVQPRKTSLAETITRPPRFTTTLVDEAEHAASVGLQFYQRNSNESVGGSSMVRISKGSQGEGIDTNSEDKKRKAEASEATQVSKNSADHLSQPNIDKGN